jgi:ATP-dependent DNA helicase PIF1
VTALNKVREGKPDMQTLKLFNDCQRPLELDSSIKPTKMYPIRALVQEENSREFEALKTPIQVYAAIDSQYSPDINTPDFKYVLNDLQAAKGLRLRVGCQVMLLANLNTAEGLVNGSRGVVIEFVTLKEAQKYLSMQATLRGASNEDESIAASELRKFANGNESMLFPRVLFELKDTTREVILR